MKTSQFLLATVKEAPSDAKLVSHRLMIRAGMIKKLASGLYTWLPLGFRVLQKVIDIVRQEMNRIGGLELAMPVIQPSELWLESQRWEKYGPELLRITDRHKNQFCFGPTHEEVITDIIRHVLRSYKQLPLTLYQIQTKFRDEIRPRFGVMRSREFLMKDAYSFHLNQDSLNETYQKMYDAYSSIFTRLGLNFRPVLADTGAIGGDYSHEFQVLAAVGEDTIVYSDAGSYAANIEKASSFAPQGNHPKPQQKLSKIATPGIKTVKALAEQKKLLPQNGIKTLIVKGVDHELVALVLRGDHELNTLKAEHLSSVATPLVFADDARIREVIGAAPGSLGVVNLKIPYIVDRDAAQLADFCCGANEDDYHYINVNWGRDAELKQIADIRNVVEGDLSPDGKGHLKFARGIEVGQVFQLGDKYSKKMGAKILNDAGKSVPLLMGCYGIGVSRIVAAAIEQNHDDRGIVWPASMAPFDVVIVPMQLHKSYRVREVCEKIYMDLIAAGYDVLFDDRKERAGVMFSDMDLIGIPHRLVVSEKAVDQSQIEYKARNQSSIEFLPMSDLVASLKKKLNDVGSHPTMAFG